MNSNVRKSSLEFGRQKSNNAVFLHCRSLNLSDVGPFSTGTDNTSKIISNLQIILGKPHKSFEPNFVKHNNI